MLRIAVQSGGLEVNFVEADIQSLSELPDASWDLAVASLCLMDLPDQAAVFGTAAWVLAHRARMSWTLLHPCFGSPHSEPHPDPKGCFGSGSSGNTNPPGGSPLGRHGPRGGGCLSPALVEYLNSFIRARFQIDQVAEPVVSLGASLAADQESHRRLPPILGVVGTKS